MHEVAAEGMISVIDVDLLVCAWEDSIVVAVTCAEELKRHKPPSVCIHNNT